MVLNEIIKNIEKEMVEEKKIHDILYEKARQGEIPFIVFKSYGRNSKPSYTIAVNKSIWFHKVDTWMWVYGSTGHRLKDGNVRIATKTLQEKLINIDDKIWKLQKQKRELLKQEWSKCMKLSWQKAQDFEDMKKQLFKED